MMYEIAFPETTTHYFKAGQQGDVFTSNTSKLYIKYCHTAENNGKFRRFQMQYTVYGEWLYWLSWIHIVQPGMEVKIHLLVQL